MAADAATGAARRLMVMVAATRVLRRPRRFIPVRSLLSGGSVLIDVLPIFERLVGVREGVDVQLFDGDVGGCQPLAHGPQQDLIAFQVLDRIFEAAGQSVGASNAGRCSRIPAMNWRARGERLYSAPAS